jgi:hypothetical protein
MLTMSKVHTYKRFNGDIDGWARVSRKSNSDITENEWTQLDQLIQKLTICKKGLGSEDYCMNANEELYLLAPEDDVRNAIMELILS